jgi:endonuclease YncB( thermonuclease family)
MRWLWAVLFTLLLASAALADCSGPVVSVLDGETIEVLHKTRPERIRLVGSTALKQVNPLARMPNKPLQP